MTEPDSSCCIRKETVDGVVVWRIEVDAATPTFDACWETLQRELASTRSAQHAGQPTAAVLLVTFRSSASNHAEPASAAVPAPAQRVALSRLLLELPFPIVAGIAGPCHDAWAEFASWCDGRVVCNDSSTTVGFPAVRRGDLPHWTVTAILPRRIAWHSAVEWLAVGDTHGGDALRTLQWADRVVPLADWQTACVELARTLAIDETYRQRRASLAQTLTINPVDGERAVAAAVDRVRLAATGHQPAARVVGQLVVAGAQRDLAEAAEREFYATTEFRATLEYKSLARVAALAAHYGQLAPTEDAREVTTLGVVGAGLMGTGIAALGLQHGLHVALADAQPMALERARTTLLDEFSNVQAKRPNGPAPTPHSINIDARLQLVRTPHDWPACEAVIEAIAESPELKQQLFADLEPRLSAECLIASNTSTIPISRLAEPLDHPDRCCGMHFFNPVRQMPLVEVVRGAATSDRAIATAARLARQIGKMPIIVRDSPGFLVNRLLFAYLNEAFQLLHEGTSIDELDSAAREFGMPIGPTQMCDLIGIDIVYYAGRTMYAAFPDRTLASPIPTAFIKKGRLGLKSGAGFRVYPTEPGATGVSAASIDAGVVDDFTQTVLARYRRGDQPPRAEELRWRLILPMLLEGTRVLEEGVVADPRDVDFGVIHGLGFPAYRGGILAWAESLGRDEVLGRIANFSMLGPRWQPTRWLLDNLR